MRILKGVIVFVGLGSVAAPASAAVTTFTSSAAFSAAAAGTTLTTENYSSGTSGTTISNGGTFDGLTYNFTAGPSGTLQGGIITNLFNSFNGPNGTSLGGNQSGGEEFFFGGDSFTVTFATPINDLGIFFNVNLNSGNYTLTTSVGSVSTDSTSYDTDTFVFDGLISDTAFTSATFTSTDSTTGSYNVPEITFGATPVAQPVPEPATLALFGMGFVGFGVIRRYRKVA